MGVREKLADDRPARIDDAGMFELRAALIEYRRTQTAVQGVTNNYAPEWFANDRAREAVNDLVAEMTAPPPMIHESAKSPRGPHVLTSRTGERDYCGGPGRCAWCDGRKR